MKVISVQNPAEWMIDNVQWNLVTPRKDDVDVNSSVIADAISMVRVSLGRRLLIIRFIFISNRWESECANDHRYHH